MGKTLKQGEEDIYKKMKLGDVVVTRKTNESLGVCLNHKSAYLSFGSVVIAGIDPLTDNRIRMVLGEDEVRALREWLNRVK